MNTRVQPTSALARLALVSAVAWGASATPAGSAAPPFTEKFVDVAGIRTRYLEAGSGDPVVLIHGGNMGDGVNADRWDRNIGGFARGYRVIAFDSLGQGFTDNPKRDADYTMAASVEHTYNAIRALGLGRVHLVGASRGGYLVTRLALLHPEIARSIVVCNTATLAPETGDPNRRDQLVLTDAPKDPRGAEIHRLKQLSFSDEHITPATVDLAVRIMQQPKSEQARAKLALLAKANAAAFAEEKADTLQRLKAGGVSVPMLLVWGYNDRSAIMPNALALFDILAAGNPGARLYVLNQAAHYDYREHPDEFVDVVTAFLRGRAAR
jgi:pimeloyl-ACP methyl ester carboxylesterase